MLVNHWKEQRAALLRLEVIHNALFLKVSEQISEDLVCRQIVLHKWHFYLVYQLVALLDQRLPHQFEVFVSENLATVDYLLVSSESKTSCVDTDLSAWTLMKT